MRSHFTAEEVQNYKRRPVTTTVAHPSFAAPVVSCVHQVTVALRVNVRLMRPLAMSRRAIVQCRAPFDASVRRSYLVPAERASVWSLRLLAEFLRECVPEASVFPLILLLMGGGWLRIIIIDACVVRSLVFREVSGMTGDALAPPVIG